MADAVDGGLTERGLWGFAWALGILAAFAWLASVSHLDGPGSLDRTLALWLAVAVTSTVFSAACAVLCGVKNAAQRLAVAADRTARPGS